MELSSRPRSAVEAAKGAFAASNISISAFKRFARSKSSAAIARALRSSSAMRVSFWVVRCCRVRNSSFSCLAKSKSSSAIARALRSSRAARCAASPSRAARCAARTLAACGTSALTVGLSDFAEKLSERSVEDSDVQPDLSSLDRIPPHRPRRRSAHLPVVSFNVTCGSAAVSLADGPSEMPVPLSTAAPTVLAAAARRLALLATACVEKVCLRQMRCVLPLGPIECHTARSGRVNISHKRSVNLEPHLMIFCSLSQHSPCFCEYPSWQVRVQHHELKSIS
mmetsp:Transcript_96085/g.184618  ORF Transcript_96085/g.184618 Transcript_96085/m.184618 type:complete len:281 (+) Transcript_96085:2543-3385(+)